MLPDVASAFPFANTTGLSDGLVSSDDRKFDLVHETSRGSLKLCQHLVKLRKLSIKGSFDKVESDNDRKTRCEKFHHF